MAKKQRQPGYKKFIGFVYVAISVVLIYTLSMSVYRVVVQKNKLTELQTLQTQLEADKAKLSKEVELLNDDDYVARYARDNYVFPRDGEEVVKLPDSKTKK